MPDTVLDRLARLFPASSRQTLRRMLQDGRVRVNGKPVRQAKALVQPDDSVEVADKPRAPAATLAPLRLVYEDADVLVVSKPPGLLTSTTPRERRPTALAIVRAYAGDGEPTARIGLIHRLDADASGLLVFSKNAAAYDSLKEQFFHHRVTRQYSAIVRGVPKPRARRLESRLVELPDGRVRSTKAPGRGEHASTHFEVLRDDGKVALVRVTLHTGRKHQIRVHLSELGHPIVGDPLYGAGGKAPHRQEQPLELMLCATTLAFDHPRTGERVTFEIKPPRQMLKLLPLEPNERSAGEPE